MATPNVYYGLTRDELAYELLIRGEKRNDLTIRQSLQVLNSLEGKRIAPPLNPSGELEVCAAKLTVISELVDQYTGTDEGQDFEALNNRIGHLLRRALRVTEPTLATAVKNLSSTIGTLDEKLESKCRVNKTRLLTSPQPRLSVSPSRPASTPSCVPIYKWNYTYDGTGSIVEFLEGLEGLRKSRRASKSDLFNSAYDLFKGSALLWYRANSSSFADWDSLVDGLNRQYKPLDYDHHLWTKIMTRTQAADESPTNYLNEMLLLFSRLSTRVAESKKTTTIRCNLKPEYYQLLAVANRSTETIAELTQFCQDLELSRGTTSFFSTRPVSPVNNRRESSPNRLQRAQSPSTSRNYSPVSRRVSFASNNPCWNCRQTGHHSLDCREPKNKFCYKCGHPGFITATCPKCNPRSGNESGGP